MKILIIYRHYWPDTPPLGSMLRTLAETLVARGHRVYVLTAQPSYQARAHKGERRESLPKRETRGGVRIIRLPLLPETGGTFRRAVNMLLFQVSAFSYAARHRFDLLWANTLPPVYAGFNAVVAAKACGARLLYHMQDVYPEVWRYSTGKRPGALKRSAIRTLAVIDSLTCRVASAVVVLSDDMMRTIADRGGNGAVAFHVINNFIQAELTADGPPPKRVGDGPFRLVFSGNLGRFQNLDLLLQAMALIKQDQGITLEFIGSGVAEAGLRETVKECGLTHVHFTARLPSDEAFRLTRTADLGVISLLPGMYRVSYPSKLMTYMAAGLPVLALMETDSALAHYLDDNDAGVAAQGDAAAIADAIRKARDRFASEPGIKPRIEALADRDFGRKNACERWAQLIDTFAAD